MFGIDQQVQQTADAYRGKPQMLQQKYAQNQQLIDLLALQKLKSDKEEASRQMALSMGGQGTPPTIADQRESQVLDMTKKEVIDEQAGVMQNKMKQMQDAQRKVLQSAGAPPMPGQSTPQPQQPPSSGLAGIPAPNMQGMAGGGIVAFSGETGSDVKETKEVERGKENRAGILAYLRDLAEAPFRIIGTGAENVAQSHSKEMRENFGINDRSPHLLPPEERANRIPNLTVNRDAARTAYRGVDPTDASEFLNTLKTVTPAAETPAAKTPPAPQAAPQGTGGGAPIGNAPGTVGFGIQSLIGTKTPDEAARENEVRAAAAANYTPEERAAKERQIQERSAADKDAELINFLFGASGRSTNAGAIAAGGAAAQNTRNQALAARHRAEGELIDIGPASRMAGTKAGEARYKDVVAGMSQGVDAAVKQAQIASSAADRQLAREGLNANNAQNRYTGIQAQITRESARLDRMHKDSVAELSIRGLKPNEYKIALAEINAVRDLGYQQVQNTFAPVMQKLESDMGISSANGFSLVGVRPNTPPK
jgi:hypothetical protein